MVTKSFGKRDFMQPMGRPKHALKVPFFFSFYVLGWGAGRWGGGGWERDFFSFFPASQCVCTMVLSSSQWVPNIFPNIFSIPPHFYPICLEANGKVRHPFRRPNFLIWVLRAGGRGERVFFSWVAYVFLPCSQVVPQVFNVFLKGVPNST